MRALFVLPILVAACGSPSLQGASPTPVVAIDPDPVPTPPVETLDPTPPPPPPPRARTVEQFDTTTKEDRAEALAKPAPAAERKLGRSVASLGSPTDPGIWIKTPLVSKLTPGRAVVVGSGKSINVELRPAGANGGSGAQVSLPAMRLLEVALTDLPELDLFAK